MATPIVRKIPKVYTTNKDLNQVQENICQVVEPLLKVAVLKKLPTSSVGLFSGDLWADPSDSYRVKMVP